MKKEKDPIETKARSIWHSIKDRLKSNPSYNSAKLCQEWEEFDNFFSWFKSQVDSGWYQDDYHIDKDILGNGKKIYSPEYCAMIPKPLNLFFIDEFNRYSKRTRARGLSVVRYKDGSYTDYHDTIFRAKFTYDGKLYDLGEFDSELEAFFSLKFAKEEFLQELADSLEGKIDPRVCEAVRNYKVRTR